MRLLTIKDIAALLKVHKITAHRKRAGGLLPDPVISQGRMLRWDAAEVEDWIRAGAPPAELWRKQRRLTTATK